MAVHLDPAILVDFGLALEPSDDIDKVLASVALTNLDPFGTLCRAVADDGDRSIVTRAVVSLGASPDPSNAVGMIPDILLLTVSIVLARLDEFLEIRHRVRLSFSIVDASRVAAIEVSEEDARIAIDAHQNKRVRQRLELRRHSRL